MATTAFLTGDSRSSPAVQHPFATHEPPLPSVVDEADGAAKAKGGEAVAKADDKRWKVLHEFWSE